MDRKGDRKRSPFYGQKRNNEIRIKGILSQDERITHPSKKAGAIMIIC